MTVLTEEQFDEWVEAHPELAQCYGDVFLPADELDDIEEQIEEYFLN